MNKLTRLIGIIILATFFGCKETEDSIPNNEFTLIGELEGIENGTWIKKAGESDYKELVEAQPVEHGDHLRLGDFEVLVCLIPKDKKKRSSKASTSKTVDKEDK